MSADPALSRLRDDPVHTERLARLALDDLIARPASEVLPPRWLAQRVLQGARDATAEPRFTAGIQARVKDLSAHGRDEERPARAWLPDEAEAPLRDVLGRPWVPSEDLTFALINHPALRTLVREVLRDSLTRFVSRLRSLDSGLLGGVGQRAARRGKGLFGGLADAAQGVVGAVREEVGHAMDGRIKDFLGQATEDAVRGIAQWIADPEHAPTLAAMRLSALDVLLDTPVKDLVAELDSFEPEELVQVVVRAVADAAEADDAEDRLTQALTEAWDALDPDTLGAWLDELGLRDVWYEASVPWVAERLRAVVATEAFAAWWAELHG